MINDLKLKDFKNVFFESKKFLLIYLIFITITTLSTLSYKNMVHPKFELLTFALIAILGIFCIVYYFLHDSEEELHKVAFVIILCFGILTLLIVPICDVSDEIEHFAHAEIESRGIISPHWTGEEMGVDRLFNATDEEFSTEVNEGAGFWTIQSQLNFNEVRGHTIFETEYDTEKINHTPAIYHSAFEQNPFYGYLPQAVGIFIAKLLDLNAIWMLWLGRLFNLLCYASLISLAIKKTPYLKIPLLTVACIPIALYQAASCSIDSMIIGLGLLLISYLIYFCKSKDNSLGNREILIFSILCVLLGLCKLPYLAFIFLLLFVPKEKFSMKNSYMYIILCILLVSVIGLVWSKYATPALLHSWRSGHSFANSTQQINFLFSHPMNIGHFVYQIFTDEIVNLINGVFNFFGAKNVYHYTDTYFLITPLLLIFLALTMFFYPKNIEFKPKTKIGVIFVLLLVYVGTCIVQLLTWSNVGESSLGISIRYFIPLLAFLPIIFNFNYKKRFKDCFDDYAIVFIIVFMATLVLSFATKFY